MGLTLALSVNFRGVYGSAGVRRPLGINGPGKDMVQPGGIWCFLGGYCPVGGYCPGEGYCPRGGHFPGGGYCPGGCLELAKR